MGKKRLMHAPVDESRHKKMTAERSSGLIDRLAYARGKEAGVDFSVKEANRAKVSALFALDQAAPLLIFRATCHPRSFNHVAACPIRAAPGRLVYGPKEGDSR